MFDVSNLKLQGRRKVGRIDGNYGDKILCKELMMSTMVDFGSNFDGTYNDNECFNLNIFIKFQIAIIIFNYGLVNFYWILE